MVALTAVPPAVVTRHLPSGALVTGTVAVIWVGESTVKVALTSRSVTDVAPVKFVPVIVTFVPTGPVVGVKLVIVGAGVTEAPQFGNLNDPIRVRHP